GGREVTFDPLEKPGVANLLTILAACTGTTPDAAAAGLGSYRELKQAVTEAVVAVLGPLQRRYADVTQDPGTVAAIARPARRGPGTWPPRPWPGPSRR
ncbi:MAG TPA: hypothetical protein VGD68_15180, partial [Streptosporangiaceae bacterium]